MEELWTRIKQRLAMSNPALLATLAAGASSAEIEAVQRAINVSQDDLFASLEQVNGQISSDGAFYERFVLFSASEIAANYALMNEEVVSDLVESGVDLDEGESVGPVKPQIWSAAWIPFAGDGGNFLCLDTDPDEGGSVGQVFSWWRDGAANTWLTVSYRAWLESVADA